MYVCMFVCFLFFARAAREQKECLFARAARARKKRLVRVCVRALFLMNIRASLIMSIRKPLKKNNMYGSL